jgi:hypothetical protein
MGRNVELARRVLRGVASWPDPAESPAARALEHAIITEKGRISPHSRERLHLLVGRYLPVTSE